MNFFILNAVTNNVDNVKKKKKVESLTQSILQIKDPICIIKKI